MRRGSVRPGIVLAAALAVLAALVLVLSVGFADARVARTERCSDFARASAVRVLSDTGAGRRVVVIGDSYSVGLGLGLDRPGESWPSRLPGQVHVAGLSGSGFSAEASACGRVSYADRASAALASGADLVVIQGGLNDGDRTDAEIEAGFERFVSALEVAGAGGVPVLVVGPAAAPSRLAQVPRVDALLAELAARHHAPYLSVAGLDLPYLPGRLHLTAFGHRALGDVVAARLVALSR